MNLVRHFEAEEMLEMIFDVQKEEFIKYVQLFILHKKVDGKEVI